MSDKTLVCIIGAAVGLLGFGLIFWALGWVPTLGLSLAMWGNNMQRSAARELARTEGAGPAAAIGDTP